MRYRLDILEEADKTGARGNEAGDSAVSKDIALVQVMLGAGDGGAETFFEKLAIAFQRTGLKQTLVIQPHPLREKRLREAGCDVRLIDVTSWRKWLAPMRIRRIIRETNGNVSMGWMTRGSEALPRMRSVARLSRIGGYYKSWMFRGFDRVIVNAPQLIGHMEVQRLPREKIQLMPNFTDPLHSIPRAQACA